MEGTPHDRRYLNHQSRAGETGPRLARALPERSGSLLDRVEFFPPGEDWWGHETERAPRGEDHAGIDLARRRLGDLAPASHVLFYFLWTVVVIFGVSYILFCHFYFMGLFVEMGPLSLLGL